MTTFIVNAQLIRDFYPGGSDSQPQKQGVNYEEKKKNIYSG